MILLGIMGDRRVAHSLSPAMHTAVMARLGMAGAYLPFAVEPRDLPAAVAGLAALGFQGANVTVPHKEAVAALLDELAGEARAVGAVNTIVRQGRRLVGHNTDVAGFRAALAAAGFDPRGREVLVFGAGGAARAVVRALVTAGAAQVWIAARSVDRARRLAARLGGQAAGLSQALALAAKAALVVNATSVTAPGEGPELARLVEGLAGVCRAELVVDLNYGRTQSIWAGLAAAAGAAHQDGLTMLAAQARASFALWTGREVPLAWFQEALEAAR
jgi:shikimate dehydrogenase